MTSIESEIQNFVAQNLLFTGHFPYDNNASFLREGMLDSMGVMEVVMFVTNNFRIPVEPHDVTPENFDSVNRLAAFIRRRQAEMAPKN